MGLPNALQGLEEEANRLHREAYPEQYKETPAAEKTVEAPAEKSAESQAQAPPSETAPSEAAQTTPPETPPEAPAAPPEAPPAAPEGYISQAQYDALSHKFDVLTGKYNAEVPRTAAEIRALKDELAALKGQPATAKPDGQPAAAPADGVTMEQRLERLQQEYGSEYLEDMEYFFRSKIMKELEGVRQTVDNVVAVTSRNIDEQYVTDLSRKVPDWQTIVKDPGFANYMNEEEGNTGVPRINFAKEFQKQRNADKVGKYYTDYKSKKATVVPAAAQPSSAARMSKEALVAPSSTPSAPALSAKDEIAIVRASELDKFARDMISGVYRGREKEAAAIQAKHDAAQAAGRIVTG